MKSQMIETKVSEINGIGVFASKLIKKGMTIFDVENGYERPGRTKHTVEWNKKHYDHPLLRYVNHSKQPNMILDKEWGYFCAVRDIRKGEEITFDYRDTESEFAAPFAELFI